MPSNCKCSKCGHPFEMGTAGIYTENGDLCDGCAGIVRLPNGEMYNASSPYELCRKDHSRGNGVRPGDTAYLHPNRGTK